MKRCILFAFAILVTSFAVGVDFPFNVYTDNMAKGNHYVPSGWMGDVGAIQANQNCTETPYAGKTCIKITYTGKTTNNQGWIGIYWQNPANNWGSSKGGYNLTGAKTLEFWARGEKGGETVEFKMGGITGEFSDTDTVSGGPTTLTSEWKKYSIDLSDTDLSYISGGFCFAASQLDNPDGAVFYLDDIQYVQ